MITVRRSSVAEIEAAPNFEAVLVAYGAESAMPEIGAPKADLDTYRAMQQAGIMHPIAAFDGALLAAFMLPLVVQIPHYSAKTATVESVFCAPEYRKAGVFGQMRTLAREICRDLGARALLFSAVVGSDFGRVLHLEAERGTVRHSNDVFVELLA